MKTIKKEINEVLNISYDIMRIETIGFIIIIYLSWSIILFWWNIYISLIIIRIIILWLKIIFKKEVLIKNNFDKNILNSIYSFKLSNKKTIFLLFLFRIMMILLTKYYRLYMFLMKIIKIMIIKKNIIKEIKNLTPWGDAIGLEGEFNILNKKVCTIKVL